ncbi:MAG: alpha/beta fold hydrolase [Acidimicrobiales bacterium]
MPTSIVVGTADVLTPPRHARSMASRIPGAKLYTLPKSGHMAMLERPEELAKMLKALAERA